MSKVKQASKRKGLTKCAGVPALGAAGLGLSLVGSASSATAVATADVPQSLNTTPDQRLVLSEEEMVDVSLATFYVFDKENGAGGLTQVARGCGGCGGCRGGGGCGGGCRGGGCGGGCRGCGGGCGCGWGGYFGGCGCGYGYGGCCGSWGACRYC